MPVELNTRAKDFAAQFATLLAARGDSPNDVDSVVAAIVEDVQRRGDAAVMEYTHKFDRVTVTAETMALSVPVTITQSRERIGPMASAVRAAIARLNAARAERMASSAVGLVMGLYGCGTSRPVPLLRVLRRRGPSWCGLPRLDRRLIS